MSIYIGTSTTTVQEIVGSYKDIVKDDEIHEIIKNNFEPAIGSLKFIARRTYDNHIKNDGFPDDKFNGWVTPGTKLDKYYFYDAYKILRKTDSTGNLFIVDDIDGYLKPENTRITVKENKNGVESNPRHKHSMRKVNENLIIDDAVKIEFIDRLKPTSFSSNAELKIFSPIDIDGETVDNEKIRDNTGEITPSFVPQMFTNINTTQLTDNIKTDTEKSKNKKNEPDHNNIKVLVYVGGLM